MALIERFEAKFMPEPMSGCWLWTGATGSTGYGSIFDGDKIQRAHRVSYELYVGKITGDLHVCHKCDNHACVNPDHLFLGTHKENMHDMIRKGRRFTPREELSKLTAEQIEEIKSAEVPYGKSKEVAAKFGLSYGGFYKIRKGMRWGHV